MVAANIPSLRKSDCHMMNYHVLFRAW
jgi:hypothetical protein